jgi:hypothetical protein
MARYLAVVLGAIFLTMTGSGCEDTTKHGIGAGGSTGGSSPGSTAGGGTGGSSPGSTAGGGTGGSSPGSTAGGGTGGSSSGRTASGGSGGSSSGGTCGGAVACGGALDGTWQIDSMCVQGDWVATMGAQLGLPAACSGALRSVSIDHVSGTISYSAGTETANITMTVTVDFMYTQVCVAALSGTTGTLDASMCASFQQALLSGGQFSQATCSYSNAGCRCVETGDQTTTNTTPYTVSGNNIVYSDGTEPMGYCVSGSTLTERQTSTDSPGVTMVATFHRAP